MSPRWNFRIPAQRGPFTVETLSYGSGKDLHRKAFGVDAALISETVDGSHLIDGWSGLSGWARTQYWGFDATQLPLQGRVWFPKGDGPFPLVLMVHGNHDMEDFSDPGYAYLGELFASRGIIAVSVDENFLNSSFADLLGGFKGGLEKENDARAWMLLEHLRLWRQWNQDPQNRFHGKVDLDRVALIGHSRGGEAVAIAALFNRLPFYPDDARVVFDYGFKLRGVIAIAPSDEQYEPRSRATEFDDVSYLVIQGSRDGDVQSYMGSAQYSRVGFDECDTCFKAGLYLLDANHGQFNTSWGRNDLSDVWGRALNLVTIMDPDAQRNVAKVLFGAFLEVVLNDRGEYRAFLENPASGRAWLGQDVQFVNEYSAADETPIANFDEDADLTTGSTPGVQISGTGLARWYETQLPLKWNDLATESAAIGWNRTDDAKPPELRIDLDATPDHDRQLSFSLAMSDKSPLEEDADWKMPDSIDFHVVLTDRDGREASIALSSLQLLYKPIEVTTRKLAFLDAVDPSEPIFQRYAIPTAEHRGYRRPEHCDHAFSLRRDTCRIDLSGRRRDGARSVSGRLTPQRTAPRRRRTSARRAIQATCPSDVRAPSRLCRRALSSTTANTPGWQWRRPTRVRARDTTPTRVPDVATTAAAESRWSTGPPLTAWQGGR